MLYLFYEEMEASESERMLTELIPKMAKLAINLPKKICKPIPILKQGTTHAISMTQEQCASILANAFFCTFPMRFYKENSELLPYINFNEYFQSKVKCVSQLNLKAHFYTFSLFSRSAREIGSNTCVQKLKCIFHYFQRVTYQSIHILILSFLRFV